MPSQEAKLKNKDVKSLKSYLLKISFYFSPHLNSKIQILFERDYQKDCIHVQEGLVAIRCYCHLLTYFRHFLVAKIMRMKNFFSHKCKLPPICHQSTFYKVCCTAVIVNT